LRAAGFAGNDVQVFKPAPRKGNLVARLRGTGARKPILLMAHLDVVEALASDWSFDPFKLTEKDGYLYGRGSGDDKFMAATFVANLIRYKQENFTPTGTLSWRWRRTRRSAIATAWGSNGWSRTTAT
jgi:acetylornithine deacetylase/succinyl-diaminopimelate desuccinylase-like protein